LVSGSSNLKVGDIVREGDILVYPYIIDNAGNKKSIIAKANIALEVDFNYTISYNEIGEEYVDTGNKFVSKNLSLYKLNFNKTKPCPFKNYRTETKEYYVFNNMFLPLKKTVTVYYEQAKRPVEIPFEKVRDDLINKSKNQVLAMAKGCEILDQTQSVSCYNNIYYVTATAKALVKIGG
jgi:hypothetical protein